MYKYSYRVPGLFKTPAQIAGEVCEMLEKSPDGLNAQTLLDASRDEKAPLHCEFEWNDTIAAEGYRREQAKSIIRNLYIYGSVTESEVVSVRSFVSVSNPQKPNAYVALNTAMNDEVMRQNLLDSAKREMKSFMAKYAHLRQLANVIEAMRKAI